MNVTVCSLLPQVGKLVYCTRTVPEIKAVLAELQEFPFLSSRCNFQT